MNDPGQVFERPFEDTAETAGNPYAEWSPRYRAAWVAGIVLSILVIVVSRTATLERVVGMEVAEYLTALGVLFGLAALVHVMRRAKPADREPWKYIVAGVTVQFVALLGEAINGSVLALGIGPDVVSLCAYPLMFLGGLRLINDPRDDYASLRFGLDAFIATIALFALTWHFILHLQLQIASELPLKQQFDLVFVVLNAFITSIAVVIAFNTRDKRRDPIIVIAAGVFLWGMGHSWYAYVGLGGTGGGYPETVAAWFLGSIAFTLGALHPDMDRSPGGGLTDRRYRRIELVGVYIPFAVSMGLAAYLGYTNDLDQSDVILAVIAIVALIGRQLYILTEASDLSRELVMNEELLEARNRELALVNRIVRHDIRNNMMLAAGWTHELADRIEPGNETIVEKILNPVNQTVEITETLRDFVELLEDSNDDIELSPVRLRQVITEIVASRSATYPDASIELVGDPPDVEVYANTLLTTVFRNILNNAIQHNDAPEPEVTIRVIPMEDVVQIQIADNGPGIDDDSKTDIFGRGNRGLESQGSGVGLYLVDALVKSYNGAIWVEDNQPRGTIFVIELPLQPPSTDTEMEATPVTQL